MLWKCVQYFWPLFRKILFWLPAETAHDLAIGSIEIFGGMLPSPKTNAPKETFGLPFPVLNPVGLAAGLDKNSKVAESLPRLGFGFAEIGTVTPKPQAGNPKPRMFRLPSEQALFNRMGFNNDGAEIVAKRFQEAKDKLARGKYNNFSVGVNIGKNKDTANEHASSDYVLAAKPFKDLADYLVINVSSPNTVGLRSLQAFESLRPIIESTQNEIAGWKKNTPLFVKLAPELSAEELAALIAALDGLNIGGFILTNTLQGIWPPLQGKIQYGSDAALGMVGGYSGKPLARSSLLALKVARKVTQKPIISVGGIFTKEDVQVRLAAGANAVQIYTGYIYGGPFLVRSWF